MKLEVYRISSEEDSTSGIMFEVETAENPHGEGFRCKRRFLCYTLEDEKREDKVMGETRIPAGKYDLKLRKEGGFDKKYSHRFADIHRGMLHVTNVPNFKYVLIHCGNTDENTAGCLLVGDSQENNQIKKNGFIGNSTRAYMRIYPKIAKALDKKEQVTITYIDFD